MSVKKIPPGTCSTLNVCASGSILNPPLQKSPPIVSQRSNSKSNTFTSLTNTGGYDYNSVDTYKAEIGGVGGITNARSLAGMLTPLAQNNEKLLSKNTVKRLSQSYSVPGIDSMLMLPTRFSEILTT